jgi:zinc protease
MTFIFGRTPLWFNSRAMRAGGKNARWAAALAAAVMFAILPARAATEVKTIDLGKDVQVWFAEDHTIPIVAFTVSLPAGSAYDPGARPGLAGLAASLMDEGAGNLDSTGFHQALAAKAIRLYARADRDYTVVTVTAQAADAAEAMRLLQMALTKPRFDNEAVARVKAQIVQSLQQDGADPRQVASRAFMREFFNGHPYGHATDGEIQAVAAATQAELKAFARAHWVKTGAKIAVAGDISQAALTKLLGQTFAPVAGGPVAPPRDVGRLGAPGVHGIAMAVPQPNIYFGLPGIMRDDPDFLAGYVANYILGGGGFSSRMMTEVREKRGLTYGISTAIMPWRKASVWVGQVATRADAVNQTLQVVRDTMTAFAANGPTQAELDDAKTFLTGSFPLAFASNTGLSAQLATYQRQGLDAGYVARRNSLIQAVTLADVRRVAKRLFNPARLTVVVAGTAGGGPAPQRQKAPVVPPPRTPPVTQSANTPAPAPGKPATSASPTAKTVDKPVAKPAQKPTP